MTDSNDKKYCYYNGVKYQVVAVLGKDKIKIQNVLYPRIVRVVYTGDVTGMENN